MKNLLVVAFPGDEVVYFGGLLLQTRKHTDWTIVVVLNNPIEEEKEGIMPYFNNSCIFLGAKKVISLDLSEMQIPLYSIDMIVEKLQSISAFNFDNIFTYNVIEEVLERQITAVAVAKVFDKIHVRSMGGKSNLIIKLSEAELNKKINLINVNYGKRIARRKNIYGSEIKDIEAYQVFDSKDILKYYYENLSLPIYDFLEEPKLTTSIKREIFKDNEDPWDLRKSLYESERYSMELKSLDYINWNKIIEAGACEGYFTKMILNKYPDREIIAMEPNPSFYITLKNNLPQIKTLNIGVQDLVETCDILFISSLMYYIIPFPQNIFSNNIKYILMSHNKLYHENVIDPIMRNNNFKIIYEADLPGKIEQMWNILDTKEGTNIKIWMKK